MQEDSFSFNESHQMPPVDLDAVIIAPEVLKMVSVSMAQVYRIVPISFAKKMLTVAMADPTNVNTLDDLRFMLNVEVNGAICREEQLSKAIERYYPE